MKNRRGFTLIEMMVTIVIIGILASLAFVSYLDRKKKVQYNSAFSQIQAIAAAEKNYYLSQGVYTATTGTSDTNADLGIKLSDDYFKTYKVNAIVGPPASFNVTVFSGTASANATYTFDRKGTRIACSGSDCLP